MTDAQEATTPTAPVSARSGPSYSDLSADQREAYDAIVSWIDEPGTRARDYLTLGGLAGTGKSTIAAVLARELESRRVVFTSFTGKAVDVLSRKLAGYGVSAPCLTLHSLMYTPLLDDREQLIEYQLKDGIDADLVVVDEASMISAELWRDLQSFGVPIVAVGDHGQLPPVGAGSFSLMADPDLRLEKIHRQAEGNPILSLAHHVRAGGSINDYTGPRQVDGKSGPEGIFFAPTFESIVDYIAWDFDAVAIAYFNHTRCFFNSLVRQRRGYVGPDFVICLRNARVKGGVVFNGMRGILTHIEMPDDKGRSWAQIVFPDHRGMEVRERLQVSQFGRPKTIADLEEFPWAYKFREVGLLFDYGYCLTGHKSQGSQWRTVVVHPEQRWQDDNDTRARWLYTTVSRASERLVIV